MDDDQQATLASFLAQARARFAKAKARYEAMAGSRPPSSDPQKTTAELLAELKSSVPENEAILRAFTPEGRQVDGGIAAGKLASTVERVEMLLENFGVAAQASKDGAAFFRAEAEKCQDATQRARLEELAQSFEDLRREIVGEELKADPVE